MAGSYVLTFESDTKCRIAKGFSERLKSIPRSGRIIVFDPA